MTTKSAGSLIRSVLRLDPYIGGPRFLFIVVDWVIGGLITEPVPRPFVLDTSYYA